ncbi:MAG: UDP-N-acetylmuramoyl-L-alanine--D-glutamate ligase, partial [Elusimicrobia bacterium]|nr:UDP-N-acetylmuramoyl-L-alanine--D-glutamate ligase [Elusimicrobiota bacterium]
MKKAFLAANSPHGALKKISVLGLGVSGIAAANLAVKLGYEVFASDSGAWRKVLNLNKKVVTEFGGHSGAVLNANFIIKSPGITNDIPIIKKAKKSGIPVISELDFALARCNPQKVIAVTGTNGKTTVTDLSEKIIASYFKNSAAAGNIGTPLSELVSKNKIKKNSVLTLETSSYQLEDSPGFKPDISILLNITEDHLDHHKSMRAYIKAKAGIFKNQTKNDCLICNYDDKICRGLAKKAKCKVIYFSRRKKCGVYYENGSIFFPNGKSITPKINIAGIHNIENILAAAAAAYVCGVLLKNIERAISKYKGIAHRIEFVKETGGVKYYNDSKATNVGS